MTFGSARGASYCRIPIRVKSQQVEEWDPFVFSSDFPNVPCIKKNFQFQLFKMDFLQLLAAHVFSCDHATSAISAVVPLHEEEWGRSAGVHLLRSLTLAHPQTDPNRQRYPKMTLAVL